MAITLGWWLLPLVITIVAWAWALTRPVSHGSYLPDPMPIIWFGAALIVTLASWLTYFAALAFL